MSGSVLLHLQLSSQNLEQLRAWYKIRDTLLGENDTDCDVKKALELVSVCEHPNAVWLTKLSSGCDVDSHEEARQVFLGFCDDPRALCFAGWFGGPDDEILQAAVLGDAFAQAWMAEETVGEESFYWAERSAAQGERVGLCQLGRCYLMGSGFVKDVERAKENYLLLMRLGM
jgi:hypothetical protein